MQLDLFPKTLEAIYIDGDYFDLSKPPLIIQNAEKHYAKYLENRVNFLKSIPENKLFIFKEGVDNNLPVVYNKWTGKYPTVDYSRAVYPCIAIEGKRFYLHNLVSMFFIYNDDPYNKCYVDHVNHNPHDYRIENLQWVTNSENMTRGFNSDEKAYMRRYELDT